MGELRSSVPSEGFKEKNDVIICNGKSERPLPEASRPISSKWFQCKSNSCTRCCRFAEGMGVSGKTLWDFASSVPSGVVDLRMQGVLLCSGAPSPWHCPTHSTTSMCTWGVLNPRVAAVINNDVSFGAVTTYQVNGHLGSP